MDEVQENEVAQETESQDVWSMNDEEFNEAWEGMFNSSSEEPEEYVEEEEYSEEPEQEEEEEYQEEEPEYSEDHEEVEEEQEPEEEESAEVEVDLDLSMFQKEGIPVQTKDELMYLVRKGMNQSTSSTEERKLLHMLKTAKVDGNKLNLLLDVADNKPEAIAKILKESGLDAFDLDGKDEGYIPTNREVSNERIALDDTLQEIGSSESGKKLINAIAEGWDEASHEALGSNPQHLHIMNEHMRSGVFETVQAEVKRQRMFGGLKGMSDIVAYQTVGQAMAEQGAFSKESKPEVKKSASELIKEAVKPVRKPQGNKASAGIGKHRTKATPQVSKDIWKMSPEELAKFGEAQGWNY